MKADWGPILCPGGCGKIHRQCCDSVLGEDHQSICRGLGPYIGEPVPSRLVRIRRRLATFRHPARVEVAPCPA